MRRRSPRSPPTIDPGPSGGDADMVSANLAMSDHRVAAQGMRRDRSMSRGRAVRSMLPTRPDRLLRRFTAHPRGAIMPKRNARAHEPLSPAAAMAAYLDDRNDELLDAVATVAALVARVDGRIDAVERGLLIDVMDRNGFLGVFSA